jgi:hypothetical protein
LQEEVPHEADTFWESRGPGLASGDSGASFLLLHFDIERGLSRYDSLEFWAEPTNSACSFVSGSGRVEVDEAKEDFLGRKVSGPTICLSDGTVKVVVEMAENRDESVIVDSLADFV